MRGYVALLLASALLVSACASVEFAHTGKARYDPRPEDCEFTVYTVKPGPKFDELGVIGYYGTPETRDDVTEIERLSRKLVCQNGGDGLLLWEADPSGAYVKATVIRIEAKAPPGKRHEKRDLEEPPKPEEPPGSNDE